MEVACSPPVHATRVYVRTAVKSNLLTEEQEGPRQTPSPNQQLPRKQSTCLDTLPSSSESSQEHAHPPVRETAKTDQRRPLRPYYGAPPPQGGYPPQGYPPPGQQPGQAPPPQEEKKDDKGCLYGW
ncbi:hypothetical protein CSUB01_07342 [Colletotrichum sublineola]|uniref:Uncharacterized protein n=1 Tax=Colletotrichum sublineola TaxID=1173701 RepID=A0A066XIF5_COLSU|nr:hypothetical protein CSUB01_07342 [Colletotrichum sublineola]